MFRLTFTNGEDHHALYAASRDALERYAYRADLHPTDYQIHRIVRVG